MNKTKKRTGFSLVELIVVIGIMGVLTIILTPALLTYVEKSRKQKDASATSELISSVNVALGDALACEEIYQYSVPKNYSMYVDSSGVSDSRIIDEEYWAPAGEMGGITITFHPDAEGDYYLESGKINQLGNREISSQKKCDLIDLENLYGAMKSVVGSIIHQQSLTYRNSDYTLFVQFEFIDDHLTTHVSGSYNGTNTIPSSPRVVEPPLNKT